LRRSNVLGSTHSSPCPSGLSSITAERIAARKLYSAMSNASRSTRAKSLFSHGSQGSQRRDPLTTVANSNFIAADVAGFQRCVLNGWSLVSLSVCKWSRIFAVRSVSCDPQPLSAVEAT
jgi:hypothetical protein